MSTMRLPVYYCVTRGGYHLEIPIERTTKIRDLQRGTKLYQEIKYPNSIWRETYPHIPQTQPDLEGPDRDVTAIVCEDDIYWEWPKPQP
jgi:hypothetical protein